jgi:hypothetical protein
LSGERDVKALRPFAAVPGRDVTKDQPAPFDVARAYYEQRQRVAVDAPLLRQLIAAVDWTNDLTPPQWAQWYSVALGFQPDLILELGRGRGNSTAVFCQAAATLGGVQVVSLCHSGDWTTLTAPRLAQVVGASWFDALDARMTDIENVDYRAILGNHRRVLLLWDAHGFEIAEIVFGEILPLLLGREHFVIMHDILDNRYAATGAARSYAGQPLWRGSAWQRRTGNDRRVNIGWMHAIQDQVVAVADFSARNDLEIGSADREYSLFFDADPNRAADMRRAVGDEFFSTTAQWAFLSLTGKAGPFQFPGVTTRQRFASTCRVDIDGVGDLPIVVQTPAQPWGFGASWRWRPVAPVPDGAQAWLRVRVHIDGASIGVGLLASDGRGFIERRAVSPSSTPTEVLLPIADASNPGVLVVQTWAASAPARIRIDALTVVW